MEPDTNVDFVTTEVGKYLQAQNRNRDGRRARILCAHFKKGQHLAGDSGIAVVDAFASDIEERFRRVLRGADGLRRFYGLRTLSRRLWATSAYDPTGAEARKIAEVAVQKYADWSRPPQQTRYTWSRRDARGIGELLHLAEAHLGAMVDRRCLGKGQVLVVEDPVLDRRQTIDGRHNDRLEELMHLRDQRSWSMEDPLSSAGLTAPGEPQSTAQILLAKWVAVHDLRALQAGDESRQFRQVSPNRWMFSHDVMADWGHDHWAKQRLEALEPLDDQLWDEMGCRFADVTALLDWLARGLAPPGEWDEVGPELARYGYLLAPWPTPQDLAGVPEHAHQLELEGWQRCSFEGVGNALERLTVQPAVLRLDDPLYRRPLVRVGGMMLYDALSVHVPDVVLHDHQPREDVRDAVTRVFEAQVHTRLGDLGGQPFEASWPVVIEGVEHTDLDASVVVDRTLVAVDTYSVPWTSEQDRGDRRAVKRRHRALTSKLAKWTRKWDEVIAQPPEWLGELGIDGVLPVVVTAGAEWIESDKPGLWLVAGEVPRFCTAGELAEVCKTLDLRDLGAWRPTSVAGL